MSERPTIVAGNWKMNKSYDAGRDLAQAVCEGLQPSHVQVVLGVPFIHLKAAVNITSGVSNVAVSAQNCHQADSGAYTGEVSAEMLASTGCTHVILGHSERRDLFGESDGLIAEKVVQALKYGLTPIFCCGEHLPVREAGNHEALVGEQIKVGLFGLDAAQLAKVVIAYEPVWAIGTGVTASPAQAQEMHAFIRGFLAAQYGQDLANAIPILYGGSVKPDNAAELFSQPDVDGGLVGGASLKAEDFLAIIEAGR